VVERVDPGREGGREGGRKEGKDAMSDQSIHMLESCLFSPLTSDIIPVRDTDVHSGDQMDVGAYVKIKVGREGGREGGRGGGRGR